jgi:hypothetical protein
MYEGFSKICKDIVDIAIKNDLEVVYRPDFHDELDFVIGLRTEAVDYRTLENPTCVQLDSYLVVTLPKVQGSDGELEASISKYNYVAQQLMGVDDPQYLLGVSNGRVEKLMWCIWE